MICNDTGRVMRLSGTERFFLCQGGPCVSQAPGAHPLSELPPPILDRPWSRRGADDSTQPYVCLACQQEGSSDAAS